jgi:hypothetical protein
MSVRAVPWRTQGLVIFVRSISYSRQNRAMRTVPRHFTGRLRV